MYEKLVATSTSRNTCLDGEKIHKKSGCEIINIGTEAKGYARSTTQTDGYLIGDKNILIAFESFIINNPRSMYALEDGFGGEDDFNSDSSGGDAFGGFDSNTSSDSGDGAFDFGGSEGDGENPFDFDGASDDSDSFFGDGSGAQDNQKAQPKEVVVDRVEATEVTYSINRNVREVFPKRFLDLKNSIKTNVEIIEKSIIRDDDQVDLLAKILKEYEYMNDLIDEYINGILDRPYEDIFATYVAIHTSLVRLKKLYINIIDGDTKTT